MGGLIALLYGNFGCCWGSIIGVGIGFVTYGFAKAFNNSIGGDVSFGVLLLILLAICYWLYETKVKVETSDLEELADQFHWGGVCFGLIIGLLVTYLSLRFTLYP